MPAWLAPACLASVSLMHVGDIELVPLSDGTCKLPPAFYVGLDFAAHQDLLAEDGLVHIPVGCFLLRSGETTVLIDAGLGDVDVGWAQGGELPAALRPRVQSPRTSTSWSAATSTSTTSAGSWSTTPRTSPMPSCATARATGSSS